MINITSGRYTFGDFEDQGVWTIPHHIGLRCKEGEHGDARGIPLAVMPKTVVYEMY